MPPAAQYAAEKARRRCQGCGRDGAAVFGLTRCAACLGYSAAVQARDVRARCERAARQAERQYLACCGGWQEITSVPFRALCCGTTYFTELAPCSSPR